MFDRNIPEVEFALQAVRQAAMLVRTIQSRLVTQTLTKADRSPVTVADFAAQALVGYLLSQSFPDDVIVAEEDSTSLREPEGQGTLDLVTGFLRDILHQPDASHQQICSWIDQGRVDYAQRFWTLDPIDGTKGFLRGDQYAVALALVENGQVQIGVLGCPNMSDAFWTDLEGPGSLIVAVRGQGTWTTTLAGNQDFTCLAVSSRNNPADARILRSFESGHTNVSQIDLFSQALGVAAEPVRMDSQAKYGLLAAGKGDLLVRLLSPSRPDYKEKIWDQAAGSIILEEAGGRITDLHGLPLDFTTGRSLQNNRGVLASNGVLHESALDALRQINA